MVVAPFSSRFLTPIPFSLLVSPTHLAIPFPCPPNTTLLREGASQSAHVDAAPLRCMSPSTYPDSPADSRRPYNLRTTRLLRVFPIRA
ncbi:hypothetical protein BDW02DRAFT_570923 [Decorospora gaudefroyi]|uniref:Uncharacterized protein n=1 Tax=Decorospora gaudefroyi TaxID=184978 RepID=A0A6A5K4D0_9PLEO|nr:hypothetical protein BDW02DRAFT_570923 [Decorospora gaudefroyi]